MRTHTIHSLKRLFLIFILPLALLTIPVQALTEESPKAEGSKSKSYRHGSPHGMKASPHSSSTHGKPEGSGSKHGYSKGHGSKKCDGKKGYSHDKHRYSKHGCRHGGHGKDPFRHVLQFAGTLGLTDAQISQIKSMKFEFTKKRIMLKAQHEVAHMDLDQLVHSGEVKESKMKDVAKRIAKIKSQKIHSMVNAKIDLLKLLTPEQRKKISQLHSKH